MAKILSASVMGPWGVAISSAAVGQSRTLSYIAENCRVDLLDCLHVDASAENPVASLRW